MINFKKLLFLSIIFSAIVIGMAIYMIVRDNVILLGQIIFELFKYSAGPIATVLTFFTAIAVWYKGKKLGGNLQVFFKLLAVAALFLCLGMFFNGLHGWIRFPSFETKMTIRASVFVASIFMFAATHHLLKSDA